MYFADVFMKKKKKNAQYPTFAYATDKVISTASYYNIFVVVEVKRRLSCRMFSLSAQERTNKTKTI